MSREKNIEAILIICIGLIVFHLILEIKELLFIAVALGIISVLFPVVAKWVTKGWYFLAEVMGFVMNKVILTIVFFIVLFPMALLAKATGKITVRLKKDPNTYWTERNHVYEKKDLENTW